MLWILSTERGQLNIFNKHCQQSQMNLSALQGNANRSRYSTDNKVVTVYILCHSSLFNLLFITVTIQQIQPEQQLVWNNLWFIRVFQSLTKLQSWITPNQITVHFPYAKNLRISLPINIKTQKTDLKKTKKNLSPLFLFTSTHTLLFNHMFCNTVH